MNDWLIPMLLGSMASYRGFGGYDIHLSSCMCINDYNKYSKKYERYGVDE